MQKPNDWDKVKAYEERRRLPAGGYVCEVKRCEELQSQTGKDMIKVAFEIIEGEYKGFFMDELNHAKEFNADAKWPFEGTKWILTKDNEGRTNRLLKGFVTSIEAENVTVSWDDNFSRSVQGATLGVVFRDEESEYNDLKFWRAVPNYFCSAEDIRSGNFTIPKAKALDGGGSLKDMGSSADTFQAVEADIPF